MKKSKNLLCSYDEYEIAKDEIEYRKNNKEEFDWIQDFTDEQIEQSVYEDYDLFQINFEDVIDTLTTWINSKNTNNFKATVSNFGWQHQSGYTEFQAVTGQELLQKVLPATDCTFYVYKWYNGLKIVNYHHDAPTGETYIIKPI